MADPAEIRAEGRRLWADYSESDETGVTRDEWERWWYFHADVLLADPSPKCRRIGGPVTLAQSLHMVQPGQEIPKLVFDVCEQVLERFTVCVPAPAPADVLLADPAPVDDRTGWGDHGNALTLAAAQRLRTRLPPYQGGDAIERVPEGWRVEWRTEEPHGPGEGPREIPYLAQIPMAVSPSVDPEEEP